MKTETLSTLLRRYGDVSENTVMELASKLTCESIKSGDNLIDLNEIASRIFFIRNNCVRFYQIVDSEEITIDWLSGPAIFTSYSSFCTQSPSSTVIQAMDKISYCSLGYENFIELCAKHKSLLKCFERLMQGTYNRWTNRICMLLNSRPLERCQWFEHVYADCKTKVPMHMAAGMLGLSAQEYDFLTMKVKSIS